MLLRAAVVSTLLAGGVGLVGSPASASAPDVSLIVGLSDGTAAGTVVAGLDRSVDVAASAPLSDAVAVEIPANQIAAARSALLANPAVAYVEPNHTASIDAVTPDDPYYSKQWGVTKTGVNQAWSTTTGSSGITVAVVDTGVTAIPDLAGRVLPGYDFVNGDSNPVDDNGHGTLTAGVIAASGDNNIGIAGLCWACKILPVKVLNAKGTGTYDKIAEGIRYAADQGADIINLSLGGTDASQLLTDAVDYATQRGALVIAAAGNDGSAEPHYPAAIPAALAVGGSDSGDNRYTWSNYGSSWVDIAAPGCNVAQTKDQELGDFCGTSSATPFVAGAAALVASAGATPADARDILTSTADEISGGWVAAGRVDAQAAVAYENSQPVSGDAVAPTVSFSSPAASALVRATVTVKAAASDNTGITKVRLLAGSTVIGTDTSAPYSFAWNTRSAKSARTTLTLQAYDRGGNVTSATRAVVVDNTGPTVKVSAPANGTKRVKGTKYVTVNATDGNGISRVQLLVNGKVVATATGANHRFSVVTSKYGKTIKVQVRGYDRAGNSAVSAVRTWYR